jgi:hypothetical protein
VQQSGDIGLDVRGAEFAPGLFESGEFEPHVGEFLRIGHALRLDAQDGDFIEQFAR